MTQGRDAVHLFLKVIDLWCTCTETMKNTQVARDFTSIEAQGTSFILKMAAPSTFHGGEGVRLLRFLGSRASDGKHQ